MGYIGAITHVLTFRLGGFQPHAEERIISNPSPTRRIHATAYILTIGRIGNPCSMDHSNKWPATAFGLDLGF